MLTQCYVYPGWKRIINKTSGLGYNLNVSISLLFQNTQINKLNSLKQKII